MDADPPFVKEIHARAARGDAACQSASRCLQATRSVICSSKCAPTAAAYFAAVVSALQQLAHKGALENQEESFSSLLLILRRALPQLPSNLVAGRLNDIVTALTPLFRTGSTSSETSTRLALQCLSCCAEAAYSVDARPNRKVLRPIFGYLSDPRSAVRRQAELSAVAILEKAQEDSQTLAFASQQLTQMLQNASNTDKKAEEIPAQRAVSLLRATAPLIPDQQLGDIFVALTKLPALLGQHPCCTAAFDFAAEHLTPQKPWEEEMAEAPPNHAELAARFLPGLLEVPLSMLNVAYVAAFVRAIAAAVAQLCGKDALPSLPLKLAATKKILSLFSEQDPGLLRAAGKACSTIFSAAGETEDDALLQDLLETLRPLLRFEVKGSWCFALPAVGALFDALDSRRSQLDLAALQQWDPATFQRAKPLVIELIEVRDKSRPGELNVYGKELQEAIASAIKTFGPQQVLRSMPLEVLQHPLTDVQFEQKSRSWMLLVLKDSCQRTALQDFSNFFIPLASALKAKASEAAQQDAPVLEKKYLTLVEQVWALLPGFCTEPLDMQSALLANGGQLAKQLVAVLQNDSTLRDYIWASLKRLCDACLQPSSRLTEALQKHNQACLKTLQSRLMPEMLNAYIKMHAEMEGQDASRVSYSRQQALQAITSYARLVDATYIGTIFKSLVAKWLKATTGEGDASDVPALGDLATILIPHLGVENLELVLRVFAPALKGGSEDKAMASAQKAGYQAITAVMQHEAAASLWKVQEVTSLWATLQEARQTCTALKARLLCLQALLSLLASSLGPRTEANMKQEYLQCLTTMIPEVLFHLRDQSTAVREAARESLHLAATTAIHQDLQAEIVTLVSAGLAGLSRHAKAAALDALSRLLYEHHSKMASDLRKRLIHVVLLLLDDHDPQVWRGALKFTKVVVFVVPKEGLLDLLPKIMKLFESRHLASAKMLIRSIVERLVKILPEEILEEAFPKAHQALLRHVQKQFTRLGRPQTVREKGADDDWDKEEDEEETSGGVEGRKAKREKKPEETKETWESFKAGDEAEQDLEDGEKTEKVKKRSRGAKNEPPTEFVMAHNAVQALLDAWEADEEGKGKQGKRKRTDVAASTWIQEDGNVPIDFMSADAAHSVLTVRAPPSKKIRGAQVGNAGAENQVDALRRNGLRFAADGRLVVDETAEVMEDQRKEFSHGMASEKPKALSQLAMQRKARAEARAKAKAAKKGVHLIKGLDTYKPGRKKAQGDAQRKGSKLEPFAYVRLNPKVTKEKFKTKATETFAKVVQGAKKGVVKGMKARAREQKLKHAREVKKRKQARSTVKTRGSR